MCRTYKYYDKIAECGPISVMRRNESTPAPYTYHERYRSSDDKLMVRWKVYGIPGCPAEEVFRSEEYEGT